MVKFTAIKIPIPTIFFIGFASFDDKLPIENGEQISDILFW